MSKQAIIYARVSTDEQADKGYSLETQLEAMRRYAAVHGFILTAEIYEEHSGAVAFGDRPRGREVAAMLKRREATVIIAYQVDRLSRDIVDLLATCREWLRAGIEVHTCEIGKIESESDILLVLRGWQGADERKRIVERMSRGRNGKAKAGKVVGAGCPPYGYCYADGQLQIYEPEAAIVRMIYQWYTVGDGNGEPMKARAIAREFSKRGISGPGESFGVKRKRRAGIWSNWFILRLIQNETYAGLWRYGKLIGKNGRGGKRALAETIAVEVPAIVGRETWQAAQTQREYNKQMSKRNTKSDYLLRGIVSCGCGFRFCGWNYKGHMWYRCSMRANRYPDLESKCTEKNVKAKDLESFAFQFILEMMTDDPAKFEQSLLKAQEAEREAKQPRHERLATVKEQIAETEAEADKLATALKNAGGVVGQALQRQIDDVNQLYAKRIVERDSLRAEIEAATLTDADIESALQFRQDVIEGLRHPTFEDKRRALEVLRVTGIVKDGKVTFVGCILVGPRVFELPTSKSASSVLKCR